MKKLKRSVLIMVVGWLGGTAPAFAQGTAFTYQGRLNVSSSPATGSYDIAFTLYDSTNQPGNIIVGPITNSATDVTNGLFTAGLDFGAGVFTGDARWLEIAVRTNGGGSFTTLTPRQQITPTPYAIMANNASNLLGTLPTAQLIGTFPASQLSGTIPSANLLGTYGSAISFTNGLDTFSGTFFGQFFGDGSGLTNLNASQLTTGTVPNARLPINVAFVDSNQTFTAQNVFQQPVGLGNPTPVFPLDALASQAVGRFTSTNAGYGSVLVLRNIYTNFPQYLGAINFENPGATPGQIAYVALDPTNQNLDYMQFSVAGVPGFRLQADGRGMGAANVIGGYPGNAVSSVSSGGDVIAGGGYGGGYNLVLSNSSGVFIGSGSANQIGPNVNDSFIGGGYGNTIQAWDSVILGGANNSIPANGDYGMILGGYQNAIQPFAYYSSILGGLYNNNGGAYSSIGNGYANYINPGAVGSVIGGGYYNYLYTNNYNAVIGGGYNNNIYPFSTYSTIGGGYANAIFGNESYFTGSSPIASTIAGGANNLIYSNSVLSTIGGGYFNSILENTESAIIAGGKGNFIGTNAAGASIGGGSFNHANASGAVVPGGFANYAEGLQSFAAGTEAHATHDGSFVFADYHTTNFYSTAINQFSARFSGGIRFETAGAGITVDGQQVVAGIVNGGLLFGVYPNLLIMTNSANVFAGNGTGLTLNASNIVSGTLPSSAFGGVYSNAVTLANTNNVYVGNGTNLSLNANNIVTGTLPASAFAGVYTNAVTLNNTNNIFAGNGTNLTLNANNIVSGTLPNGTFGGVYTNAVTLNNTNNIFAGNGTNLTLNANNIVTGTLPGSALAGVYTNALTLNNTNNSFAGSGLNLNLSASKIVAGTLPSTAFAGVYSNAVTLTNPANVFTGNGAGLTNVNAATLNGSSSSSFAPAANSPNYIQNQTAGAQIASFNINGSATVGGTVIATSLITTNAQVTGLLRSGSETGTANPPNSGLVIRRLNSTSTGVSNVVARTDVLTLERDGSNEGLLIRFPAAVSRQTINGLATTYLGTIVNIHTNLNSPVSAGTIQILPAIQDAIHVDLSFGNTFGAGYMTHVVMDRYEDAGYSDNFWVGTLTSTYNQ